MDAQGFERSYNVNSSILLAIQPQLIHFHQLLLAPPKVTPGPIGRSHSALSHFILGVDLFLINAVHYKPSILNMVQRSMEYDNEKQNGLSMIARVLQFFSHVMTLTCFCVVCVCARVRLCVCVCSVVPC